MDDSVSGVRTSGASADDTVAERRLLSGVRDGVDDEDDGGTTSSAGCTGLFV